jgi:hypothetical protein
MSKANHPDLWPDHPARHSDCRADLTDRQPRNDHHQVAAGTERCQPRSESPGEHSGRGCKGLRRGAVAHREDEA